MALLPFRLIIIDIHCYRYFLIIIAILRRNARRGAGIGLKNDFVATFVVTRIGREDLLFSERLLAENIRKFHLYVFQKNCRRRNPEL